MKKVLLNENTEHIEQSRRDFLRQMGVLSVVGIVANWVPSTPIYAMQVPPSQRLKNFPANIPLYRQQYKNWSGESKLESAWTCSPKTPTDVIRVINWAYKNTYKVRPKGMSHNWSPLMLDDQQKTESVLLIDLVKSINRIQVLSNGIVTAEAGALMEDILEAMESRDLGFVATPAPGDLTIGGVLAIDGHGTGVPALNEHPQHGQTYGSLSNLITSITAIIFNPQTETYIAKVFKRDDHDIAALLVHLGRAFILSVQLQASTNRALRCESLTHIHEKELFAADAKAGYTFSHYLDQSGRVEAIWFPFTDYPWIKVWTVTAKKPKTSKIVRRPFNYWFSDNLPPAVTDLIHDIVVKGHGHLTPHFGHFQFKVSQLGLRGTRLSGVSNILTDGLVSTQTQDLWGLSKNLLLYVKPTTLRVTANGYAVITSRSNVQRVIHDFCEDYKKRVAVYRAMNRYPMNGPVEIRVTGLDHASDSIVPNAKTAILSAIKPCPDHPEWDCAVWFDILTLPGTRHSAAFYAETEQWMLQRYQGDSLIRPEWSKGWGYTETTAWANPSYLKRDIPQSHAQGQPADLNINAAKDIFDRLDPHRIFTSPLLDKLL